MTIQDYLLRLKQWRQQLCMDKLIVLVLTLTNALLLVRKPAVELILPFMEAHTGIQSNDASQVYFEWRGLSLAELLGNLNQQNLSFVESRLQSLLSQSLPTGA